MHHSIPRAFTLTLFLALGAGQAACSDDAASDGGGGSGADPGDGGSGAGVDVQAYYACDETDFTPFGPMNGPGFDPDTGAFLDPHPEGYVIHTTQLIVKPEANDEALQLSGAVFAQLQTTPGFLGVAVAGSTACSNLRTLGVWESEEAMYAMVGQGAHAQAMARTTAISVTGRVTHWDATAADVEALDWDVAKAKIDAIEPSPIYR